ncbi:MAG: hypothetical protein M1814_004793 [Vezdaea aestivalis]|nr:MAG: hypothetical protein M1814_004793 [Vezdaea aestivalis]
MATITPASTLPDNVHVSSHSCLAAKLSQLRSNTTSSRETKTLIHEISLILACEALGASLRTVTGPPGTTSLPQPYTTQTVSPASLALIPILRSGLSMVDAFQSMLPYAVPVHHLGLFREPTSLQPVEYYNNLPYHSPPVEPMSGSSEGGAKPQPEIALLLDPVVATGGTSAAAVQTLREWGAGRVVLVVILGSVEGLKKVASEWGEGTSIYVGAVDESVNDKGMIVPGLGDVGDRLFLTIGK